ncbi:MAG: PSD1 and planctomycete cytochrome C domain-containing protein [Phycisphaerales bacterium]
MRPPRPNPRPSRSRRAALATILAVIAAPGLAAPPTFDRDVRPIISNHCLKCHGPDPATRQGRGPRGRADGLRLDTPDGLRSLNDRARAAVVAGDPAASHMLLRIESDDHNERMPPPEVSPEGLSPADRATIRGWLEAGAKYEPHWSFVPPTPQAPAAPLAPAARSPTIDTLVDAALADVGLVRTPEAPPAALLRRVSLDLIGLHPTLAELDAFERDVQATTPDAAYARAVERLLGSDRYGEKWARWWLDLARYADTQGYEKDARRSVWPYRDWVIRALNTDTPLNTFARAQLAGDLLPNPTEDDLVATAFHRHTMTNDEGGTDDEEFRSAAVIDRVNTTMEVFQGVTMSCVQCHAHKFDPYSHEDFYRLYAIFNNTADNDQPSDAPTIRVGSPRDTQRLRELDAAISAASAARTSAARAAVADPLAVAPEPPAAAPETAPSSEPLRRLWLDDLVPTGTKTWRNDDEAPLPWWSPTEPGDPVPPSGVRAFRATFQALGQSIISEAHPALPIRAGEHLICSVFIDPANPPRALMLQWHTRQKGWSHRAYWGEGLIPFDKHKEGTGARRRIGDLPQAGAWVELSIPAEEADLAGLDVTGWAFSQYGGTVTYDAAGVISRHPIDERARDSFRLWAAGESPRADGALPPPLRALLQRTPETWTAAERESLLTHFALHASRAGGLAAAPHETRERMLTAERDTLRARGADLPIMRELPAEKRRTTHLFLRGSHLAPGPIVAPGLPVPLRDAAGGRDATDRLALADWLFDDTNPLTARVLANRIYEQLFGVGIVETVEDFGVQGAWPANPALLDHLALALRAGNGVPAGHPPSPYALKALLRTIVLSAAYRQGSATTPDRAERDPGARLLSRFPRLRLDGETLRDAALTAAGLLSAKLHGPPVFPPQPPGLWTIIYSGDDWIESTGEDRYRRALYTFWRRTVPHPLMTTFDAPSREVCVSRRLRTNTPLQALVTLNDPAFVECAAALAQRAIASDPLDRDGAESTDHSRITLIFRAALSRHPTHAERAIALELLARERARPGATPEAPFVALAAVVLNLDETLTKE